GIFFLTGIAGSPDAHNASAASLKGVGFELGEGTDRLQFLPKPAMAINDRCLAVFYNRKAVSERVRLGCPINDGLLPWADDDPPGIGHRFRPHSRRGLPEQSR